jgi:uncharacterized YigZ family protein
MMNFVTSLGHQEGLKFLIECNHINVREEILPALGASSIKGLASYRKVIKRSEFIGYAKAVFGEEDVRGLLQEVKQMHPKATHWVWAYKIGSVLFSSDAGEPSGSAGVPVLNAIRSSNLDYVMVVVVRYFGGILLGVKGLIEAYHTVATETLARAEKGTVLAEEDVELTLDYDQYGKLYENIQALITEREVQFSNEVTIKGWVSEESKNVLLELSHQHGLYATFTGQKRMGVH